MEAEVDPGAHVLVPEGPDRPVEGRDVVLAEAVVVEVLGEEDVGWGSSRRGQGGCRHEGWEDHQEEGERERRRFIGCHSGRITGAS